MLRGHSFLMTAKVPCCHPFISLRAGSESVPWTKGLFHLQMQGCFAEFTLSQLKKILRCAQDDRPCAQVRFQDSDGPMHSIGPAIGDDKPCRRPLTPPRSLPPGF